MQRKISVTKPPFLLQKDEVSSTLVSVVSVQSFLRMRQRVGQAHISSQTIRLCDSPAHGLTQTSFCDMVRSSFNLTGVYMTNIPNDIANQTELHFSNYYRHFKEFQISPVYRPYWDKCMEAIQDRELLSHIIFCNDLFHIPPVKTFLLYYEQDFVSITGREDAALDLFVKKAIGAFWGMVFKFVLGYQGQESVSVSLNHMFFVRTATWFFAPHEKVEPRK